MPQVQSLEYSRARSAPKRVALVQGERGGSSISWIVGIFALLVAAGAVVRGVAFQAEAGVANLGAALANGTQGESEDIDPSMPQPHQEGSLESNPWFRRASYQAGDSSFQSAAYVPVAFDADVRVAKGTSAIDWLKGLGTTELFFIGDADKMVDSSALDEFVERMFPADLQSRFLFDFEQLFAKEHSVESLRAKYEELRTLIIAEASANMQAVEDRRRALLHELPEEYDDVFDSPFSGSTTNWLWSRTLGNAVTVIMAEHDLVRDLDEAADVTLGSLKAHKERTLEAAAQALAIRTHQLDGSTSFPVAAAEPDDVMITSPYDPLTAREDFRGTSVIEWLNGAGTGWPQDRDRRPHFLTDDDFLFEPSKFAGFAQWAFPRSLVSRYDFDFDAELAQVNDMDVGLESIRLEQLIKDEGFANREAVEGRLRALHETVDRSYEEYEDSLGYFLDLPDRAWLWTPWGWNGFLTNRAQLKKALDTAAAASIESLERREAEMLEDLEAAEQRRLGTTFVPVINPPEAGELDI